MAEQTFVVPLTSLRRGDIRVAGGKGANLGEIIHAGAPVPAGFVRPGRLQRSHAPQWSGGAGHRPAGGGTGRLRLREAIRAAIRQKAYARS